MGWRNILCMYISPKGVYDGRVKNSLNREWGWNSGQKRPQPQRRLHAACTPPPCRPTPRPRRVHAAVMPPPRRCTQGEGGPGGVLEGRVGGGVVLTFLQPERVFVWRSKERAPKPGRIGNLEKSCSGLEKNCHDMEKSGKMLEKKNSIVGLFWSKLDPAS